MRRLRFAVFALGLLTFFSPATARAFCGFYVAGADAELHNDATMVVLMRDGTKTVLSMRNDYQGPPEDFALVVPVPVVLREGDVKVLSNAVFDRVDKLAAPRLVEYWEQDPCAQVHEQIVTLAGVARDSSSSGATKRKHRDLGVTIEAQFEVGEYQVVILSARESTGLDTWLRQESYNIPAGAEPLLRPYVESGSKFFVAKVDVDKVEFRTDEQGQRRAQLSPLRFHYDTPEFSLPVRLGLINAGGPQDLLVHILAREVRYEVANYDNVAIPTNLDVKNEVRDRFGTFYASLFDHVLANNPDAVVTEYAWAANGCDPCPEPPLSLEELTTLGADVLPSYAHVLGRRKVPEDAQWSIPSAFVLTRLHARYDQGSLGEDLTFRAAPAIVGGREWMKEDGQLERGAVEEPSGYNNFQARYAIRHEWEGPIECENPRRGLWGGPWPELADAGAGQTRVARDLAFVPRGAELASLVTDGAKQEIERTVGTLPPGPIAAPDPDPTGNGDVGEGGQGGCAHCSTATAGGGPLGGLALGLLGLLGLSLGVARRRR